MKLRTALAILASLILAVFMMMAAKLNGTANLLDHTARDLARAGDSLRVAEQLKSLLLIHNRDAFLFTLHNDQARLDRRTAEHAEILSRLQIIDKPVDDPHESAIVSDVIQKIQAYFDLRDALVDSVDEPIQQYNAVAQLVDDAVAAIDKLVDINQAQLLELIAAIAEKSRAADRGALVLLCIGSLMLTFLIFGVLRLVSQPLATLMKVIAAYSGGDDSVRAMPEGLWETQKVAHTFNLMADRLQVKRQDQLNFIASIAHDLRNPLNAMSMAAAMLLGRGDQKMRSVCEIILRQVKNLDRMVGDLLDTTRIESGQLEIELAVHDVGALICDAVELHEHDSELHSLRLQVPAEPLLCVCDAGRISQVMNNLISNALKYSPSGGTVRIQACAEDEQIQIAVVDHGIGIAEEDLGNIFKPFHRTPETRNTIPGIGLGLSASRRIIEAHGGVLKVQSERGSGSTFSILIPSRLDCQQAITHCELLRVRLPANAVHLDTVDG
jgi:two-component system, OmpR family, sensor histidine kinase MtrB